MYFLNGLYFIIKTKSNEKAKKFVENNNKLKALYVCLRPLLQHTLLYPSTPPYPHPSLPSLTKSTILLLSSNRHNPFRSPYVILPISSFVPIGSLSRF
ncbi:hypothetical protein L2E82_39808 [Cichorium intybus]|uniref:Uncharacterized protein n=1 Tax=Cichorium intybus TaxID=13427 RepID=A0ACB9ANM4_CICIN|nr:hypothetical protein L2E82_39808 [Cichorium intybus]